VPGNLGRHHREKFQGDKSAQSYILGLVDDAHPAAYLLHNAVVRDGLADHAQACYGGSADKSMKAVRLAHFNSVVGEKSRFQCAGINRHEAENAKFLRERTSDPLGPEFCVGYREVQGEA
jgi:hypothetical protein